MKDLLGEPDPTVVAQRLLGATIASADVTIRITEVEAYSGMGDDPASHAHRGRTTRNAVMFGPAGFAYVYFSYGMHWCMNVVTGPDGIAAAVLLRAGEVIAGTDVARSRRGSTVKDRDLARGPARLGSALGIDGTVTGTCLIDGSGPLLLRPPATPAPPEAIGSGPRVGIRSAADRPWRFWLYGDPTVSAYRPGVLRSPRRPAAGT